MIMDKMIQECRRSNYFVRNYFARNECFLVEEKGSEGVVS